MLNRQKLASTIARKALARQWIKVAITDERLAAPSRISPGHGANANKPNPFSAAAITAGRYGKFPPEAAARKHVQGQDGLALPQWLHDGAANAGRFSSGLKNTVSGAVGNIGYGVANDLAHAWNSVTPSGMNVPRDYLDITEHQGAQAQQLGRAGAQDMFGALTNADYHNSESDRVISDAINAPGVHPDAKLWASRADRTGSVAWEGAMMLGSPGTSALRVSAVPRAAGNLAWNTATRAGNLAGRVVGAAPRALIPSAAAGVALPGRLAAAGRVLNNADTWTNLGGHLPVAGDRFLNGPSLSPPSDPAADQPGAPQPPAAPNTPNTPPTPQPQVAPDQDYQSIHTSLPPEQQAAANAASGQIAADPDKQETVTSAINDPKSLAATSAAAEPAGKEALKNDYAAQRPMPTDPRAAGDWMADMQNYVSSTWEGMGPMGQLAFSVGVPLALIGALGVGGISGFLMSAVGLIGAGGALAAGGAFGADAQGAVNNLVSGGPAETPEARSARIADTPPASPPTDPAIAPHVATATAFAKNFDTELKNPNNRQNITALASLPRESLRQVVLSLEPVDRDALLTQLKAKQDSAERLTQRVGSRGAAWWAGVSEPDFKATLAQFPILIAAFDEPQPKPSPPAQ